METLSPDFDPEFENMWLHSRATRIYLVTKTSGFALQFYFFIDFDYFNKQKNSINYSICIYWQIKSGHKGSEGHLHELLNIFIMFFFMK